MPRSYKLDDFIELTERWVSRIPALRMTSMALEARGRKDVCGNARPGVEERRPRLAPASRVAFLEAPLEASNSEDPKDEWF